MQIAIKTVFALVVANVCLSPSFIQAGDKGPDKDEQSVNYILYEMLRSPRGLHWEARYDLRIPMLPAEPIAQVFARKMVAVNKGENVPEKELTALLLVMRRKPSKVFTAELRKAMESPKLSKSSKAEVLLAIGALEGTSDYLKTILRTGDDRMRAAAVHALCVRGDSKEIHSVLQELAKKGQDYTGTYTGIALSEAKSFLDVTSAYKKLATNGDRLQFLLIHGGCYEHPKPGGGLPYLAFRPDADFVISEYRKLALDDPKSVKDALDRRAKEKGPTAWVVPLLLRDLELVPKKELPKKTRAVDKE